MTPHRLSARRLLSGGALFVALGALGAVSAAPATASATPLVWGHAQAWVADGDLVTGYSTVIGFGGDTEENIPAEDLFGPLADYADVRGRSSTAVDGDGASARSTVDTATVRLGVHDLADLGLLDLPDGAARPSASPTPRESSPPVTASGPESEAETDTGPGRETAPGTDDGTGGDADGPVIAEESGPEPEVPEDETLREPSSAPSAESAPPGSSPSEEAGAAGDDGTGARSTDDEDVVVLDEDDSRTMSGTDNTVEFTLSDVTGAAAADFDGTTEASLQHGDLTAFGAPVGPVDDEGVAVDDTLEVLDEEGEVLRTVPVSVRFAATEAAFDDDDEDWAGQGVRTALTVWIQVGEDEEDVLSVDFADAWALGSTFGDAVGTPDPTDRDDDPTPTPTSAPAATDGRLATTGSSLAALVTAAVVAVGGGAAATFLARKRTTALDDQIED
ncbi:hypothetical protein [Nocardiopsis sp. NRRL B-16309]|uniref:hypothetical protein n=1 Tax=Nocardiopsis sp. NRRL B-16309 TaxID=1519494 RepID=UPI000ABB5441